jgi:hypothetical protein
LTKSGKEVKGKHVGFTDFTKQALCLIRNKEKNPDIQTEKDILNSQWRDNSNIKNANGLGRMIAMVDESGSMEGDPLHAAIAMGCRVAEKSLLGKRVMTFAKSPSWINLDGCNTFVDMVQKIRTDSCSGTSTNFYKALDLILTAIEEKRVPPEEVENMILAIFSDMQIDENLRNLYEFNPNFTKIWNTLYGEIKQKYHDVGMRMYGVPLMPPHILFWNFRKTDGFPTLSSQGNTSMMSGFDPAILNLFCELGIDALRELTPFKTLIQLLDNERYLPLDKAMAAHLAK